MNIAKHMEVVFVVALAAAASASYLSDGLPQAHARPVIHDSSIATETKMAVVIVKGKRLAPAEQAPTVLADRGNGGSRI